MDTFGIEKISSLPYQDWNLTMEHQPLSASWKINAIQKKNEMEPQISGRILRVFSYLEDLQLSSSYLLLTSAQNCFAFLAEEKGTVNTIWAI